VPFAQALMSISEDAKIDKIRLCDTSGSITTGISASRSIGKIIRAMIDDAGVPSNTSNGTDTMTSTKD
jgi:hypothetical protein